MNAFFHIYLKSLKNCLFGYAKALTTNNRKQVNIALILNWLRSFNRRRLHVSSNVNFASFLSVRKNFMTLLETLIAISLLSILLVFVFGFFRELSELTHLSDQAQKESFQMRYLESRLGFIFQRLVNENSDTTRKFYFYTQPPQRDFSDSASLIFTFDNEVRLDPTFSGDVLARLYLDLDHHLCLAIWPLHVSQPHQFLQEEILFNNVLNVTYSFYAPPERVHSDTDVSSGMQVDTEKKMPEKDKWHEEWALTYDQMPSIVKMIVQVAKNPQDLKDSHGGSKIETSDLIFNFVLPSSKNYIYYPPE
jgi:hypothetical protein